MTWKQILVIAAMDWPDLRLLMGMLDFHAWLVDTEVKKGV